MHQIESKMHLYYIIAYKNEQAKKGWILKNS